MENNIEQFNYYVGYIFSLLHEAFPRRVNIDFIKILGCEKCDQTISSDGSWTGLYRKNGEIVDIRPEIDFIYETVNWLYETGYLISSMNSLPIGRSAIVTLSPKALEILKVAPSSITTPNNKKSIGQELSDAVHSASKDKVAEIAKQALSYLFQLGWGNLPNI